MLNELIEKFHLETLASDIESVVKPCIQGRCVIDTVEMGDSKVGGYPHAPKGFRWPEFRGEPLEFVCQINCTDIGDSILPSSGHLLFFYRETIWTDKLEDKDFIRVFYFEADTHLIVTHPPVVEKKRLWGLWGTQRLPKVFKEVKLQFEPGLSIPDIESLPRDIQKRIDQNDELLDEFCELKEALVGERFIQIGGYPNPVQYDGIAEFVSNLYCKGSPDEWCMILEIFCDPLSDIMWGDAGRIHYFAHEADIKKQFFGDVWMEYQCH